VGRLSYKTVCQECCRPLFLFSFGQLLGQSVLLWACSFSYLQVFSCSCGPVSGVHQAGHLQQKSWSYLWSRGSSLLVGCCLWALRGGSNQEDLRRPFRELPCTRVPDGVWCFPLVSEMCAECSLFWFPRHVCLSEGLALPPTGFGCRELFIR